MWAVTCSLVHLAIYTLFFMEQTIEVHIYIRYTKDIQVVCRTNWQLWVYIRVVPIKYKCTTKNRYSFSSQLWSWDLQNHEYVITAHSPFPPMQESLTKFDKFHFWSCCSFFNLLNQLALFSYKNILTLSPVRLILLHSMKWFR